MARFTLAQATRILPLVMAVAAEIVDRRKLRRQLARLRDQLEESPTPEGLGCALADLDARIFEQDQGIRRCVQELAGFKLSVLRLNPLTVHFPGSTKTARVVFCWQEGEASLCHGHAVGEEEEPRRPLKLRFTDARKS